MNIGGPYASHDTLASVIDVKVDIRGRSILQRSVCIGNEIWRCFFYVPPLNSTTDRTCKHGFLGGRPSGLFSAYLRLMIQSQFVVQVTYSTGSLTQGDSIPFPFTPQQAATTRSRVALTEGSSTGHRPAEREVEGYVYIYGLKNPIPRPRDCYGSATGIHLPTLVHSINSIRLSNVNRSEKSEKQCTISTSCQTRCQPSRIMTTVLLHCGTSTHVPNFHANLPTPKPKTSPIPSPT